MIEVQTMKKQIITASNGERLVVVAESDFNELLRMLDEGAERSALAAVRHRLEAGDEELVPDVVANRIIDGENRVRVWREFRGLTVSALAERAGVSQPYLSQIETGAREGTVETLSRIASALAVDLDDLIPPPA